MMQSSRWNPFISLDWKVLDGGLATELEFQGYAFQTPLWSAELLKNDGEVILKTHLAYFKAGSDVATTASYQASVEGFVKHLGMTTKDAIKAMQSSIDLAYQARDVWLSESPNHGNPGIIVSLGPYGACLADGSEFIGNYIETTAYSIIHDFQKQRLDILLSSPVLFEDDDYKKDFVIGLETMPAVQEVEIVLDIIAKNPNWKDLPVYVSFSCKDELHTNHGETLSSAIQSCLKYPVNLVAFSVNCTNPLYIQSLLKSITSSIPLITYPNRGEEWNATTRQFEQGTGSDSETFASLAREWKQSIPNLKAIGGCCRTTPDYISRLRSIMDH